jgi:hypothetical protein
MLSTKWDFFSGIMFDILNCNTYELRLSFEEYNRNIFICIVYSVLVVEVACGWKKSKNKNRKYKEKLAKKSFFQI